MSIELDHLIVPARDKQAAAKRVAELLGVPWAAAHVGPFSAVFVNDSLTLDFDQRDSFSSHHYCFRVDERAFDAIFERIKAAGIPYRSSPGGPADMKTYSLNGGRGVYWGEPDGHVWEILTVSYARQ